MPRLKKPEAPFAEMRRLLLGYEIGSTKLMGYLGVSQPTARDRLKNPGKLTLDDLWAISSKGGVPIEKIREAMKR